MVRLYLKQISDEKWLKTDNQKTIKRWLTRMGLVIYHEDNYKNPYVNKLDFELVYERKMVNDLKGKYGDIWMDYYPLYASGDKLGIMQLEDSRPSLYSSNKTVNLSLVSAGAAKFLDELD